MKSILKKITGVALAAVLALGMFSCSIGNDDPVIETVATPEFSVGDFVLKDSVDAEKSSA